DGARLRHAGRGAADHHRAGSDLRAPTGHGVRAGCAGPTAQVRPHYRPAQADLPVPAACVADRAGRGRAEQLPPLRAAGAGAGDPQPLHDRGCAVAVEAPGRADHGDGLGGAGGGPAAGAVPVAGAAQAGSAGVAALLVTGSQSWLSLSTRFLELPLGVFGVALGTVVLPSLSRHHVSTDRAGFSRALDWGLRLTLLISVPAMCALLILAEPIVATLFQHGRFNAFDTRMSTLSILALCCGLPAYALVKVLLPA